MSGPNSGHKLRIICTRKEKTTTSSKVDGVNYRKDGFTVGNWGQIILEKVYLYCHLRVNSDLVEHNHKIGVAGVCMSVKSCSQIQGKEKKDEYMMHFQDQKCCQLEVLEILLAEELLCSDANVMLWAVFGLACINCQWPCSNLDLASVFAEL